jgi:DNA invertase Pin-like site-specific DNA recombinase
MCTTFVGYLRVSTDRQGKSGLGLEAQQAAVAQFVDSRGADARLLKTYTEIESGKRQDNRPELEAAMHHAKITGSKLLIAKLDRLSRDAHFLLGLQKAGVKFTAVDMPDANNLTVGIMALVAQQEREAISQRTKAALAAAKARGQKLGNPHGAAHMRGLAKGKGAASQKATATAQAEALRSTIEGLRANGITSAYAIAKALDVAGITTPRGGKWDARKVINVLQRLEGKQ